MGDSYDSMSDNSDGLSDNSDSLSDFSDGSLSVIDNIQHDNVCIEQICSLYLNETYSDVILVIDENRFPANRSILAVRSDYFGALLFGGMQETFNKEVELKDVNVFAFKILLRYIYTGQISLKNMEDEVISGLMGLANKYSFVELETELVKYYKAILTTANCCQILHWAFLYNITQLKEFCLKYADRNPMEILESETFLSLSSNDVMEIICRDTFSTLEVNIFLSVQEWVKRNPADLEAVSAIMSKVRLVLILPEDLLKVVRPSKLVSDDVILNTISDQLERKSLMCEIKCRGYSIMDNINVASVQLGAEVVVGHQRERNFLLTAECSCIRYGDDGRRNDDDIWTYHRMEENNGGIIIKFGAKYVINYIRFRLCNHDQRLLFSYYLEVSLDKRKWKRVVDYSSYLCRSWQDLYFQPQIVKYIRIVGTYSNWGQLYDDFVVIKLEAMHSTCSPLQAENGLLVPNINVATSAKNAIVIGVPVDDDGINPMISGDCKQSLMENSGYTFHAIGKGSIVVQLAQPYFVKSMRLLLWDGDNQNHYSYFIEVSTDEENWQIVADKRQELCKSWQYVTFNPTAVTFIRLTGTYSSVENDFRCVYFECPAQNVN